MASALAEPWDDAVRCHRLCRMSNRSSLVTAGLSFAYLLTYPLAIGRADESHFLYGAKRVLEGEVLYRDFFEILTPLGYYLFAGVYWIGGTTLRAARVAIALVEAVGCAVLFQLVRRAAGTVEATLAVLIFAGLCIPAWPYASPHWIATTLGLLVAAVTLAERWQTSTRGRPLAAGMLAGAAICIQQQRGVFVAAWLPAALCLLALSLPRDGRWRMLGTELAWSAAGGALVVGVVLGHAVWAASPRLVVDHVYGYAVNYYGPAFSGQISWAGVLPLTQTWREATWLWLLRASPLFLLGDGLLLLARARRLSDRRELERACLWLLAALMALSIWYLRDFIHVSFVLPFLLVPGASLLYRLRTAPVWGRLPAGHHLPTLATWLFALAVAGQGIVNVAHAHAVAPVRLETAFGVVRGDALVAELFRAVRSHLVRETDGRTLLYSYPDDAWLYLTVPAHDATRFSILLGTAFPAAYVQEAIDAVRARRPGTLVLAVPFLSDAVPQAAQGGYQAVRDVGSYRIYVRREPPAPETSGTRE
jgi:hypothetical protein